MKDKKYNLIVVAHPDDESIYFAGLILQNRSKPWKVVCVTDGNADGNGCSRLADFHNACQALGVNEFESWDFPDVFEKRLDLKLLVSKLKQLDRPEEVYTHGILGEYGHPHHQDVCYAVYRAFSPESKILTVAYNCYPDKIVTLTKKEYEIKSELLMKNYASELVRFAHLVPCRSTEEFACVENDEIDEVYQVVANSGKSLNMDKLNKYRFMSEHIFKTLSQESTRLF